MNHMIYSSAAMVLLASSQVPDPGPVLRYDVLGLLFLVLVGVFLGVREAWRTVRDFLATVTTRIAKSADSLEATMTKIGDEISQHKTSTAQIPHETERLIRILLHEHTQTVLREFRVTRQDFRDRLPMPNDSVEMLRSQEVEAAGAELRAQILASEHKHGHHKHASADMIDPRCPDCSTKKER